MGRITVRAASASKASPEAIYPLLKDSSTYPVWGMIGGYEMERPGRDEPHGLGEIRVLKTWPFSAREEMVEFVANRKVSYLLLSGFPMLNYRGETTLTPLPGGGTQIDWVSAFDAKYPGTGWFWRRFMTWVLGNMVRDLARGGELGLAALTTRVPPTSPARPAQTRKAHR
jgi:hypothetical protein